ncbi:MAG: phosphotriesterase [Cyclobacteriaceae bacterium]
MKSTTAAFLGLTVLPLQASGEVMTVSGRIKVSKMGWSLIHEHILVDFIGADKISPDRWEREAVVKKVLPYLLEIRKLGCDTLVECTPAYLGRDVVLLNELADRSGLQILTNTGYYGARDNQHLPAHAFSEVAEQLAERWIGEFENGIDGTGIRPGFMKIGVNPGPLSEMHQKLIRAAAITHKATGLTIASHTGPGLPAFEQMNILEDMGVQLNAFIWVHAQNEKDTSRQVEAARRGAWVSLDGISQQNMAWYLEVLNALKEAGLLDRVLLSHDAGWYRPGEEDGGDFRPYTDIFAHFLPYLKENGYGSKEIKQLMIENPAEAFRIRK